MDKQGIIIRNAVLSDIKSLHENLFSGRTMSQVQRNLMQDLDMMDRGAMIRLVAESEGEVIGNIQIYFKFDHPLFYHTAEMHAVRVNKRYRRKGVASQLIKKGLQLSKLKGVEIMTVWVDGKNTPAINLYHVMGFTEYGRLRNGITRNKQYSDYVLLKRVLR